MVCFSIPYVYLLALHQNEHKENIHLEEKMSKYIYKIMVTNFCGARPMQEKF